MTVIARFSPLNQRLFIGDIAESSLSDKVIPWPTLGCSSTVFPEGSGFTLVGYTQKISIINESLIICWAGTKIYARFAENELREALKKQNDFPTLKAALYKIANEVGDNIELIGCYLEPSNGRTKLHDFQYDTTLRYEEQSGYWTATGTGAEVFFEQLRSQSAPPESINPVHPVDKAFTVTSAMLYEEHTSKSPLYMYTGGAYEIAYLVQGKFRKLDHHATAVWSIEIGEDGLPDAPLLHSVNLYYYHEDIFAITAISETRPTKDGAIIEQFSHFLAAPLEREVTKAELDNFRPTYSPQHFNHIIEIHYPDVALRKLRVTEYSQASAIQFIDDSGLVSIKVDSKLIVDQVIIFEQRRKAHQSC